MKQAFKTLAPNETTQANAIINICEQLKKTIKRQTDHWSYLIEHQSNRVTNTTRFDRAKMACKHNMTKTNNNNNTVDIW